MEVKRVKYSGVRRIIGEKLQESLSGDPHATIMTTVDWTNMLAFRKQYKDEKGVSLAGTAFMIKAIGIALKDFPQFNTRLVDAESGSGKEIVYYDDADAGIAVDTPKGLMMITVKDVANRSLEDITNDMRDKVSRLKAGKILPEEVTGSTFSISNEIMSTNDFFNSIINNNEAFIVGVARHKKQLVVNDDDTTSIREIGNMMLTYNHKMNDGMPAAALLGKIAELLAEPENLV